MAYLMITESGQEVIVRSDELARSERIAGADVAGRVVVDDFDARNKQPTKIGGYEMTPSMFGLTLCCQASDKGTESGICCRACYGTKPDADEGFYLYRSADGSFPDLDPIRSLEAIR